MVYYLYQDLFQTLEVSNDPFLNGLSHLQVELLAFGLFSRVEILLVHPYKETSVPRHAH